MKNKTQYQGYCLALSGVLLGCTKRHESIWFNSYKDALAWAQVVATSNIVANRDVSGPHVASRPKPE